MIFPISPMTHKLVVLHFKNTSHQSHQALFFTTQKSAGWRRWRGFAHGWMPSQTSGLLFFTNSEVWQLTINVTWRTMLSIHTIPSTTKWSSIWCRVLTSSPIRGPPLRVHIWWASGWRVREIHGRRVDGQQVGACRGSASRIKGSWWGWSGWSSNLLDHMVDDIYCKYIYIYI